MPEPNIAVVVDSTASISASLIAQENMAVVPYHVHLRGKDLRDMVDITPAELARHMQEMSSANDVPKTGNPGPGDYAQAYLAAAKSATTILSFHMTSIGSGAYQAACIARDALADRLPGIAIHPIDTANVSMAHGWIALQAARLANAGASAAKVLDLVDRCKRTARMLQTADTLRYLYLGGRIGKAQHLVGSLLHIRPLITMEQGEIATVGVARTRCGALKRMAELVARDAASSRGVRLALTHLAAEDEARKLAELVRAKVDVLEETMCELAPSLCVHSGPGTVGLCYLPDEG